MPSGDIHLYFREVSGANNPTVGSELGRLTLKQIDARTSPTGLALHLEHQRTFDPKGQDARWVGLWAWIEDSHKGGQSVFGRLVLEDGQSVARPDLMQERAHPEWFWLLSPADIEAIDRARVESQARAVLNLRLRVEGIVQVGATVMSVRSTNTGQIQIATSEWQLLTEQLGYGVPTSISALAPSTSHPSWKNAESKLTDAWRQIRAGEARDALESCLAQFEALTTSPYSEGSWNKLIPAMPKQKREALQKMFAGLCTYLNRVGHHRSRHERDAAGDLIEMPADQWEGELATGAAQLLLTYAIRLAEEADRNPQPQPEVRENPKPEVAAAAAGGETASLTGKANGQE